MMWRWARTTAPLLLLLMAAAPAAHAADANVVFVKARIEAAEYLGSLLPGEHNTPFAEGGDYRIKLAITDVLIGKARQKDLYLTLTVTDAPQDDPHPDIFLLLEQLPDGQFQPINWDYAENGICIGGYTAAAYGIDKEIDALQKKYPCKND